MDQYSMSEVVPKKDKTLTTCFDSYIKIWDDHGKKSLTIPLSNGAEIEHREVSCSLVHFEKWSQRSVELYAGTGHRRGSPGSHFHRTSTCTCP